MKVLMNNSLRLFLVALLLLLPLDVLAKGKKRANVHFKNGVSLYKEAKYVEALAEFERANEIAPHPLVLYNMGITYRAMSKYGAALRHLERFVSEGKGKVSRRQLRRGRAELEELLSLVARVKVSTFPDGVRIEVEDEYFGVTPLAEPLVLGPGEHTLRAVLSGHDQVIRPLRLASGDGVDVEIQMKATPAPVDSLGKDTGSEEDVPSRTRTRRNFGVSAGFGTNALRIADTGAPLLGVNLRIGSRLMLGLDALLVAFAVVPSLRFTIFDSRFSVDAMVAVPVSFGDGDANDTFVAGAAGLTFRYKFTPHWSARLDGLVSYAGKERGVSVPVLGALEFWF